MRAVVLSIFVSNAQESERVMYRLLCCPFPIHFYRCYYIRCVFFFWFFPLPTSTPHTQTLFKHFFSRHAGAAVYAASVFGYKRQISVYYLKGDVNTHSFICFVWFAMKYTSTTDTHTHQHTIKLNVNFSHFG